MNHHHASAEIGQLAKSLLAGKGSREDARIFAIRSSFAPRVERILNGPKIKAAIGATTLASVSGDVLADWAGASAAFFSSMRAESVFFRLLDSGLRRVPMRTRVGVVSTDASAFIRREGEAIPVNKFDMLADNLTPSFAAVILVMTDELAQHVSTEAANLVNYELRRALAKAVDEEFFAQIIDTGSPSLNSFPSAGPTVANMRTDVKTLLDIVNTRGTGPLIWAMDPVTANSLSLLDEPRGAWTPLGGELLGLPGMVSDAIPAGTIRLINASAIAGNAEPIFLDSSGETSLEMADDPAGDSAAPTAAQLVSMWQTHSTALMARVNFVARRMRDDAFAEITGAAYDETT